MRKVLLSILVILVAFLRLSAQQEVVIDSLKSTLSKAKNDSTKGTHLAAAMVGVSV